MKIWLDDMRAAPGDGWVWVGNSADMKKILLGGGKVDFISFDHDLGGHDTGMRVVDFIDAMVTLFGTKPPAYDVHSQNPVGAENIRRAMDRVIERYNARKSSDP